MDEDTVVGAILSGLPEAYDTSVMILESSMEELQIDTIFAKLLLTEQRQAQEDDVSDATALMSSLKKNPRGKPLFRRKSSDIKCWRCGKIGHKRSDCRVWLKEQGSPSASYALAACTEKNQVDKWILDSGASQHMAWNEACFTSYQSLPETDVNSCDGKKVIACGIGDVKIRARAGKRVNDIILTDVLHVPQLVVNLISSGKADDNGAKVHVANGRCAIEVRGNTVLTGHKERGLYVMHTEEDQKTCLLSSSSRETAELWHRRYGHLGYKNLQRLVKEEMVQGINLTQGQVPAQKVCETCVMAKQHCHTHPSSASKASAPLELIHMDVMGPLQEASCGGCKYVATFLDDFSKLSMVRGLVSKSDVPTVVKEVLQLLEKQSSRKVKAVRTDRGTEYVNATLRQYFSSKGIRHEKSAPYTPQQNGSAERLNRTLMESADSHVNRHHVALQSHPIKL